MARSLEAEKPLGLLAVSFQGGLPGFFAEFLRARLRRIDIPSRLGTGEAAVIMPRVNPARAGRLVEKLGADLAAEPRLAGQMPLFGAAFAWPGDSVGPEELVSRARAAYDTPSGTAERILAAREGCASEDTALAADEKEILFQGFSELHGKGPGGAPGPGG
jgi:hypothetical protein